MKKHFITYGSNAFISTAQRITEEAKSIGIFDVLRIYGEGDLPLPIKSSPLFLSKKGGGHWLWKPFIIHNYLQKIPDGDILVYADSGCELLKSQKWEEYINELNHTNILFFQYKDNFDYGWRKYNSNYSDSPKIKYWAKQNLLNHFRNFGIDEIIEKNKLLAGFCVIKNNRESREIIQEWLNTMVYFPHLVADPMVFEIEQWEGFAQHRHDQSVISIIARIYEPKGLIKIIDEDFEVENPGQAVRATRKAGPQQSDKNILKKIYRRLKN